MNLQFDLKYKFDSAIRCYLYIWTCPVCEQENREPGHDYYTTRHQCDYCKSTSGHIKDVQFTGVLDCWNHELQGILEIPTEFYLKNKGQIEIKFS